jgi:hypothetical protein
VDEDYLQWHTGLRFERPEVKYRPFVESNITGERRYAAELYDHRADAAVAASEFLDALREGRASHIAHDDLPHQDADHEALA